MLSHLNSVFLVHHVSLISQPVLCYPFRAFIIIISKKYLTTLSPCCYISLLLKINAKVATYWT